MLAMELKLEPLESNLRAAWDLQGWGGSSGQEIRPPQAEGTSATPGIAPNAFADSLHASGTIDSGIEMSASNGQRELDSKPVFFVGPEGDMAASEPMDTSDSTHSEVHSLQANESESSKTSPMTSDAMQDDLAQPASEDDDLSRQDHVQSIGQSEDLCAFVAVGSLRKEEVSEDRALRQAIEFLEQNCWIRTRSSNQCANIRVYVDPRLARRDNSQRSISKLREAFKTLMSRIDTCREAWEDQRPAQSQDITTSSEDDESLWYIFNTLQDPDPQVDLMKDEWSRKAMQYLLSDEDFSDLGLKTRLYPYQRRSAAMMVQREAQPARMLDPRLQALQSPEGFEYYYDKEDGFIDLQKAMYDEAVGGILAETMGCGKTLISLAVIWATRGHFPKIPIQYLPAIPIRETTGSLMGMAAAAAGRLSLPWKNYFFEQAQDGKFYDRCVSACQRYRGFYEKPQPEPRHAVRKSTTFTRPPPKRILLCSATLIIAPNNLLDHWQREISIHTDGLNVLVLRNGSDKTPSATELLKFDIVLFAKTRFEREAGEPENNRRKKYVKVDSPVTEVHWLRVIVDEGHNVAGHGQKTNLVHMLNHMHFERRWVISGTPSDNLIGLEVSLASQEVNTSDTESPEEVAVAVLEGRKKTGNAGDREMKDLDRLRRMVIEFLKLQPWSNCQGDWTKYIKPKGKDGRRRKSPAIRATLQGLVVRHQDETVSREITLPKLYNRTVYLEPTFHDRLSINLFLFGLAVNAITSERQGQDYMFDPGNRKHLNVLINNLRQAGFWWAGSDNNPQGEIDRALEYMNKNREKMAPEDIERLDQGMEIARIALGLTSWNEFKHLQELGVFLQSFPVENRAHWALDRANSDQEPLLIGITQARLAQKWVTGHLRSSDPAEGLSSRGIRVRLELGKRDKGTTGTKGAPELTNISTTQGQMQHSPKPRNNKSPKKTFKRNIVRTLPDDSPLMKTKFVATASAKLTYLLDRVWELQKEEKIIIFYDSGNSAYWIAEGLELLGIEFRIYASTLKADLREEYLNLFRETDDVRVLLMDLRQASHGLHLVQASRVFIVNPIWQPTVESQAIKRAHRLGQTRPVYVETLVLRDTLEDRMLRRRKEMSEAEMQQAEKSLLDDTTMSDIIQKEPFLAMDAAEVAYLKHPTGFFDRHPLPIPDDEQVGKHTPSKRARLVFEESDADSGPVSPTPTPKKPRIGFASSVEVIGDEDGVSKRASFAVPSSPPPPPSLNVGDNGQVERRVSLFGP